MKAIKNHLGETVSWLSFLTVWGFFQFAYPYHLMRREQLNLFLYDWDYIRETYRGSGWLARLAGDFIDQFMCMGVIGPALVALILVGIGVLAYRISRHFIGKGLSLGVAVVVFVWSFLRETDNLYLTQYSLSVLGYLLLSVAALRFRKVWMKAVAGAVFAAAGILMIGSPFNGLYGKALGKPSILNEKLIALDVNAVRGDWDKVLKLSEDDIHVNVASYFYNLASAEKGLMGENFFNHSQGKLASSLFLWIDPEDSQFASGAAGETWFRLGNMTLAEQSAVVSLQISPKHTGARFIMRLAEITLISGEYASAQKYLNMLGKTLFYRKWARDHTPDHMSGSSHKQIEDARANLLREDFVFDNNLSFKDLLEGLLRANPDNLCARQYLLFYDLLYARLDDFMEDYSARMIPGSIYEQAVLIWLGRAGRSSEEEAKEYGIGSDMMKKMSLFFRYPDRYRNTYWSYYMDIMESYQ